MPKQPANMKNENRHAKISIEIPVGTTHLKYKTGYHGEGWHWIGPEFSIGPIDLLSHVQVDKS